MLKDVVFKTFTKCNPTTEEEKLKVKLKSQINAVKTIEGKISIILNDEKFNKDIIMERNEDELDIKSELGISEKLLNKL